MKEKINTIIIGAGSIGAMKPDKFDSPKTKNVLTWAHACYNSKDINLVGIVDIDEEKGKKAANKWNTTWYNDAFSIHTASMSPSIPEPLYIEVIIVAVPTENHYEVLREIAELDCLLQPKLVICEKPFCNDHTEAAKILDLYQKKNIAIAVNYLRRYAEGFQLVKNDIDKKTYGEIYSCRFIYERGLIRDGCHAIDLCNYWFGNLINGQILSGRSPNDYDDDDLTFPVFLNYDKCSHIILSPNDGRSYSIFEIDIMTEKGRLRFIDHGKYVEIYGVGKEKTYGDYNAISYKSSGAFETGLTNSMNNSIMEAIMFIKGEKQWLTCPGVAALRTHSILHFLLDQYYLTNKNKVVSEILNNIDKEEK